jgi:methylmalonyl-CoA carboxyltransferase large subunit
MAAFLLVPLSIAAGMIAGSIAARRAVRQELDSLRASLQERDGHAAPPPPAPAPAVVQTAAPAPAEPEEITPEILVVLTAAVAAFLGKKARIRRASVVSRGSGNSWAQQGRVFVQASHNLPVQHR